MSAAGVPKRRLVFVLKGDESSNSEIVSQAFNCTSLGKESWSDVTTEDVARGFLSWGSGIPVSSKGLSSPRCVCAFERAARFRGHVADVLTFDAHLLSPPC
jgi:hypothetical protein